MDAFEKHLSDLKFQEPPADLREKCLAQLTIVAEANQESTTQNNVTFWNTWLWPHPKVWGGLAAAWLFCFWLNHWTLPLPSYSRDSDAKNHTDPTYETITVGHYTLAMEQGDLDEILKPQTPPEEAPEEGIRPNAFIHRNRPLECAWLDTALDTIRQHDRKPLQNGSPPPHEVGLGAMG